MNTNIKEIAIQCFKDEAVSVTDLISLLDDSFEKAIDLICKCKGKVIILGVGKSGHIGSKIAATLASTGTPSFFINPLDAFHGDLGMIASEDLVLALSYSGQTDELLRIVPFLNEQKIPLITITGNPDSLLAKYADCNLNIAVKKEACPLNLAPTSSAITMLSMGDAIACALIKVKGFKEVDFAKFHPGGRLGKKLLAKVKDVMKIDNLPIIESHSTIGNVIVKMSEGKLGLIIVMEKNTLKGVLTDGDLRRGIEKFKNRFLDMKVDDVMSKNPKTINENNKLADVEVVFNNYKIHNLIVINNQNKVTGVLDYKDCF